MGSRELAFALATGRALYGTLLVVDPRRAVAPWMENVADDERAQILARGLGVRDFALALGGLAALRSGEPASIRAWFAAQAISDAVDGVSTAAAKGALKPGRAAFVAAIAMGSAAIGATAATRLGR
ncbi:MAG: hypothetical protein M3P40_13280 [Actinomycetota bacterium]|nr:hypothetical protein [Actinomycetota bacterium]